MKKRYFVITEPRTSRVIAMTDSDAVGRVLADLLRQYIVGGAEYSVKECEKAEFDAYSRSAGSTQV